MGRLGRIMERKPKRYTANQAIAAIFGFDEESVFYLYDEDGDIADEYGFSGIPAKAYDELIDSYQRDEENCRIGLCGWWWSNPFNYFPSCEARFPKNAYLAWWQEKQRGIDLPKWFTEGYEWEEETSGNMVNDADGELVVAPWDELQTSQIQEPCKPKPEFDGAQQEALIETQRPLSSQMPQQKPEAPNDQTVIGDLTVADVRQMCERSGALASVLRAVAKWQAIEKENPERMTKDALKALLKAAARQDGWGTDRGEISSKQSDLLGKLITDTFQSGGRPRKNAND